MKKICLAGAIMLLALALMSCGALMNEPVTENDGGPKIVGKTTDGREIMEISIGGGTTRALTDNLAEGKINYYEVAFKSGTVIYRSMWNKGYPATIRVPVGDYAGAESAILFAGRESDKTLLAVGVITKVMDGTIEKNNAEITTATTGLTFTLYPLLTNIAKEVADTSFRITAPDLSVGGTVPGEIDYITPTTGPDLPTYIKGQEISPIFKVPKAQGAGEVTVEYAITIGPDTDDDGIADTDETANHNEGIIVDLNPTQNYLPFTFISSPINDAFVEPVTIDINNPAFTIPAPVPSVMNEFPADGKFEISFGTPDEDGFTELSLGIMAYAISSDSLTSPVTWIIKGGLNRTALDDINTQDSEGGAVLLQVGTPPVMSGNINVGGEGTSF